MPIAKIGPEFSVKANKQGFQGFSDVAVLSNGRFVVTWQDQIDNSWDDIRAGIFNADGTRAGADFRVNTASGEFEGMGRVAALTDGRFIVTWNDQITLNSNGINVRARIFNADGTQSVPEFLINTTTARQQSEGSVTALANGGFVVTWTDNSQTAGDTSNQAIRARVFNANGTQTVPEFVVNTSTRWQQTDSEVTALADGRFVVTWTDNSQTGGDVSFTAIRARIFNPNGTQSVPEFVVNTTTTFDQIQSSITALTDGRFVVSWSDANDSSGSDIFAKIFNANGTESAPEFRVNTTTTSTQNDSSITALADGRFVITWTDNSQSGGDTSVSAVRARIFDTDGTAFAPEFLVNTQTFNSQRESKVSAMADGRFVVTWTDASQIDSTNNYKLDVKSQIFDPRIYYGTAEDENIAGGSMSDQYHGDGGDDRISGRGGDDYLTGGAGSDTLLGDAGNDQLYGSTEADFLFGGADNDTLGGGQGADVLNGGTGWNTADYSGDGGVMVVMYSTDLNTGAAQGDIFININALQGSRFADVLIGDTAVNAIQGGRGGDWIDGYGGGDFLHGEDGDDRLVSREQADVLNGGAGFDFVHYDYADAGLRAYLYDATQNTGWAAGDAFSSIEGLSGSYLSDDLRGDGNQNSIFGLGGDDFIVGLGSSDTLEGADGQDTFHFVGIGDGGATGDVISDFLSGTDRISVEGAFFGLTPAMGFGIKDFRFVEGAAANLATSQFIFNPATGQLFYDQDGTLGGAQVLLATLQAGATMTAQDIFVL